MAITSIKTGSSFTNLQKYDSFLAGNTAFNPSSYESIATVTVSGSSTTTVTFSSIAGTYKSLQVRAIWRSAGGSLGYSLNGDTSSIYTIHNLAGDGSTVSAQGSGGVSPNSGLNALFQYLTGDNATYSTVGIIDLIDYASTTKYKTVRAFGGNDINAAGGEVDLSSSLWRSTAAVTSLSLVTNAANFTAGSTFALYGIKG